MAKIFNTASYANKATLVGADLTPIGDSASLTGGVPDNKTATLTGLAAFVASAAITLAGVAAAFTATAPTAAASTQAGVGVTITSSAATAGTTNAGAAAGGNIALVTGAGARLTSGNAQGGDLTVTLGAGIGTGRRGQFQCGGAPTADATADAIFAPSAASQRPLTVQTTSTQPFAVVQSGGTIGTTELQVWHDGTSAQYANKQVGGFHNFDKAVTVPVGTATVPGLAFAGVTTTGLSSTGAGVNVVASGVEAATFFSTRFTLVHTSAIQFSASGQAPDGSVASSISQVANGVMRMTDPSGTTPTWLQQTPGEACLAAPFTKNNATLGATNLSLALVAGRSYRLHGCLQVSNSTATEGVQIAFDGGGVSATTFFMGASIVGTNVTVNQQSVALATVINYSTVTGTDYIILTGFIKVNAGGTLIVRAAENTTAVGTMTMGAGSWLAAYDTVPL